MKDTVEIRACDTDMYLDALMCMLIHECLLEELIYLNDWYVCWVCPSTDFGVWIFLDPFKCLFKLFPAKCGVLIVRLCL